MKRWIFQLLLAFAILCAGAGCAQHSPVRDINAVLAANSKALMAEPGVVGVYVGLAPDQKTQCLKVMIKDREAAARAKIPKEIEGYRVIKEVTGEIQAL